MHDEELNSVQSIILTPIFRAFKTKWQGGRGHVTFME